MNKFLSASRVKKLEDCSWAYWCNYEQSLPSTSNSGASRGTACHLILEMLLNKRHKHHFKKITEANNIQVSPSIVKLVEKSLKRDGFYSEENMDLCNEMILIGLNSDFFGGKGGKVISAEQEFKIESKSPEYKIRGFIDKPIRYSKEGTVKIVDYKTSKRKFQPSELDGNIQSMAYSLATKKLWPRTKKVIIEFLFLRFPKSPSQQIEVSKDQLKGFESWLAHLYKLINNFTKKDAKSNFAADQPMPNKDGGFKGPLNCGFAKYKGQLKKNGEPMWHCEYKFPFEYYELESEEGKTLKVSKERKDLLPEEGQTVTQKYYEGCPAHKHLFSEGKDEFDF
jgi:ATP-dependent helicase/DNAse subunit B